MTVARAHDATDQDFAICGNEFCVASLPAGMVLAMKDNERRVIERLGCDPAELEIDIDLDFEIDLNFDPEEKLILRLLGAINRKVNKLMGDLTQLNAAVDALVAADVAVASELSALRDEIGQLQAGEISQEQIDSLTQRVTDVTTKLTEGVNAPDGGVGGTGGETPAPEGEPPAEPPAEGTPPPEGEAPPAEGTPPEGEAPPAEAPPTA